MRRTVNAFLAFALAAAACAAYWWWLGRPVPLPDVPGGRLQCLSYSPYDGGTSPLDGERFHVAPERIAADLALLEGVTDCLRTYAAAGIQGETTRLAAQRGLSILQGIWVSSDVRDTRREIAAGVALARRHPETVRGIFVGNEVLLRREMNGAMLAGIIAEVKAATGKPVLYADVPHFWKLYPEVARAVDVIAVHVLPYWDDPEPVGLDEVQDHVAAVVADMRAVFPDKRVMVGEVGWPSAGRTRGGAAPGRLAQARFVREFAARAHAEGLVYNLIEAIDQPWKRGPEGTVGGYWGIFDADRALKFPLGGPVADWPNWRLALAVCLAVLAAFAAYGFASGRIRLFQHWLALAAIGLATGVSLVRLAEMMAAVVETPFGWAAAGGMAALTLAGAALIVAAVEGRVAPGTAPMTEVWAALRGRMGWNPPRALAAYHWAAAAPVAMLALAIAFDGRHRDLPSWGLWIAGAALALLARGRRGEARPRREEAWRSLVLTVSAVLAFDGWRNVEAMLWMGTVLLFAVPGAHALAGEARMLASAAVQRRRPEQG